jgi:hypothetical protein
MRAYPAARLGTLPDVIYRAAAALPHVNRMQALDGLRGQLRIMAVAAGATPDWATLEVAGPHEVADTQSPTRFEWHASVVVHGGTRLSRPADLTACQPVDAGECGTAPLPAVR